MGSGFVVGPAVGGVMAKKVGLLAPPLLAAALFATALCLVSFGLPESAPWPLATLELRDLVRDLERRWRAACRGGLAPLPLAEARPQPEPEPQP